MLDTDLSTLLTVMRRMHVAALGDDWAQVHALEEQRNDLIHALVLDEASLTLADQAAVGEIVELDGLISMLISHQMLDIADTTRAAA